MRMAFRRASGRGYIAGGPLAFRSEMVRINGVVVCLRCQSTHESSWQPIVATGKKAILSDISHCPSYATVEPT